MRAYPRAEPQQSVTRIRALLPYASALAWAASDETRQSALEHRTASVADWVAYAAGVVGGFTLRVRRASAKGGAGAR